MKHLRLLAALLLVQAAGACRSSDAPIAAAPPMARASAAPAPSGAPAVPDAPDGDVPPQVATLRGLLIDAGLAPTGIVRLESRQELPGCPQAELRYRFYLGGDPGSFFNASLYRTDAGAVACRDDFQAMALKGGASAWERLRQDVYVQGSWLILFPPETPAKDVRERVLRAIGAGEVPSP